MNNIKLDSLGITYQGKWDRRKLFNLKSTKDTKTINDNNIKIKYHIVTNEPDYTIKKLFDLVKESNVGYNLSKKHTPVAMNLQINDDIPPRILLKSRKLSLLDHK
ncbi:hypothetical protein M0813_22639 [Anaeramoeba flamelloides]|uniref:Uncharacterized protein n=1 Tax=Anaeramoeba flamelloides TaxID=1746091 RepID=A0ABQ8YD15_9EUKA|nr:hypothetical protein M0813_22639 [Anaeramoeba flamelloides]